MNNLIQPLYFIDGEPETQTTGGVYIQLPFLDSRSLQCHGEFQRSVWCGEKKRRGHFFQILVRHWEVGYTVYVFWTKT